MSLQREMYAILTSIECHQKESKFRLIFSADHNQNLQNLMPYKR